DDFVKAEPGSPFPRVFCALVATSAHHPQRAIDCAKNVNYRSGRFYVSWAAGLYFAAVTNAYHQLGNLSAALKWARVARELHPESPMILGFELRALAARGDVPRVFTLLDTLEALPRMRGSPARTTILLSIAGELKQRGDSADADRVLQRVV